MTLQYPSAVHFQHPASYMHPPSGTPNSYDIATLTSRLHITNPNQSVPGTYHHSHASNTTEPPQTARRMHPPLRYRDMRPHDPPHPLHMHLSGTSMAYNQAVRTVR